MYYQTQEYENISRDIYSRIQSINSRENRTQRSLNSCFQLLKNHYIFLFCALSVLIAMTIIITINLKNKYH